MSVDGVIHTHPCTVRELTAARNFLPSALSHSTMDMLTRTSSPFSTPAAVLEKSNVLNFKDQTHLASMQQAREELQALCSMEDMPPPNSSALQNAESLLSHLILHDLPVPAICVDTDHDNSISFEYIRLHLFVTVGPNFYVIYWRMLFSQPLEVENFDTVEDFLKRYYSLIPQLRASSHEFKHV